MKDPASALGERVANGLIANEDWAREKLRAHAGRSFLVRSGPIATAFLIRIDGTLDALPARGTTPDVELHLSPLDVPALLAHPDRWDTLVSSTGDTALGGTLRELAITLPWFVERGFARAFGPIVGQRLADTGRALLGFPEYAGSRVAENVFSYARDETGVLARGDEARTFAVEQTALATRVDALTERVDRIAVTLTKRVGD
jgi:ubiquinone biosynthesis accessory factor UbiJ